MPANRRIQRSVRVTVAIVLLAVGAAVVAAALVSRGALWLGIAAVVVWGVGVAAARILSNELAESRRRHAQERAEQARAYASLAARRASENSEFASAMRQKVSDHAANIDRLKSTLRLAEKRAELAEQAAERNKVALAKAHQEIADLRSQIARLEADMAGEDHIGEAVEVEPAASADAGEDLEAMVSEDEMPTVVDLLAWEDRPEEEPQRQRA